MSVSDKGVCSICDEVFNDSDLIEADDLFLCSRDFKIFKENDWSAFKQTVVSDSNMNDALILQNMKDELRTQGKPAYIRASYTQSDDGNIQTTSIIYTIKS